MKDNINIEELFKSKFDNFEGNVDPSAWTNIQQGMNGAAGSGAAGLSGIAKVAIVTGVVAVTAVSAWYFSGEDKTPKTDANLTENTTLTEESSDVAQPMGENILATDTNDPVIQQLVTELDQDLKDRQYSSDDIDNNLVESILHTDDNNNVVNANPVVNDNGNNNLVDNEIIIDENKEELVVNPEIEDEIEKKEISSNLKCVVDNSDQNTINFKSNAKHHLNVFWDFGDNTEGSGDNVSHTYERPGDYIVEMVVNGKENSESIKRKISIEGTSKIETFANIFTPNGDGRNDFFFVKTEGIDKFYISIKDERGAEVFTSTDADFEWNGENQGGDIVKGKFIVVVIAEGEDGQVFKEMKALRIE